MPINEWTFTANVKSWIDEILRDYPNLPFSAVKVEERGRGSRKRRDLTIYDRSGKIALTGEFKMPDNPEGRSPFQDSLVRDAHEKADSNGVPHFFTCTINRLVLWKTFEQGKSITDRHIARWEIFTPPLQTSADVEHPRAEEQFKKFLAQFLDSFAGIMTGAEAMPWLPLDEKFLIVWEDALQRPVYQTLRAISNLYEMDNEFTISLDRWMLQQQWIISHKDEAIIRENLDRAAKFSCYMLANRIIFYKALRRRIRGMRALRIPESVNTGKELHNLLNQYFKHAIEMSRDYETVFSQDYGDSLPYLSNEAVASWRELVKETDPFDFTQIDYEIIGQIFERLLSTTERHKFGQHYTRSEVVDLINAFCIRDKDCKVLDPACGGGTFLVRAYKRLSDLSDGRLEHQDLLQQLYGLDISGYPAHLTTVNLATRDLIDEANYPLVARRDFFDIDVNSPIFHVPFSNQDGKGDTLQITKVDAVVGNPPYVRQEKISDYYEGTYKNKLRKQATRDVPGTELSGRSDIHCYFFTHGITFLKEGGYMGLLTSSTWLDTTYGFRLQKFLLDHFEIIAIFESSCEPWFTGARVTTAAIILRRQMDPEKRANNMVKFVQLNRPITELLSYTLSEEDRRLTFEQLRDYIESTVGTEEFTANLTCHDPITIQQETLNGNGMRIRVVNQGDLHKLGCLNISISESDEDDGTNQDQEITPASYPPGNADPPNNYIGYKWGIFLRAPNIFFKLLRKGKDAFVPLGSSEIAFIKFGIKSGCDTFFFPKDITNEVLNKTKNAQKFRQEYGISRKETDKISIIKAGDGSVHCIEKEYLERLVFNLMEVSNPAIDPQKLKKCILLVTKPKAELKGTHVLKYIRWGEREGFDNRPSCSSRELWYDLQPGRRGHIFWSMAQRYRHIVPLNTEIFICNHNLFDITATSELSPDVLAAVLNSTITAMFKHQFGRTMGGDPMLKTEVVDVKMMPIPDPRFANERIQERLITALESMQNRRIGHLVAVDSVGEELSGDLAQSDRQELDDAVLGLLGVSDPEERRALREELYYEVTELYRSIRTAEKMMQKYRSASARKGRPTPHSIAVEIWEELEEKPVLRTPMDFLPADETEIVDLPEGKAKVINDLWTVGSVKIGNHIITLQSIDRADFVKAVSDIHIHGPVAIPTDPEVCKKALKEFRESAEELDILFTKLASTRTADEAMQKKVLRELRRLLMKESGTYN